MPLFSIVAKDAPNTTSLLEQYRTDHLAALGELKAAGRLFTVGPLQDSIETNAAHVGSLIIAKFDTLNEATHWFENEPFNKAGIYKEVSITPFLDAMTNIPG
jgi:uncharacterized protein YciI